MYKIKKLRGKRILVLFCPYVNLLLFSSCGYEPQTSTTKSYDLVINVGRRANNYWSLYRKHLNVDDWSKTSVFTDVSWTDGLRRVRPRATIVILFHSVTWIYKT